MRVHCCCDFLSHHAIPQPSKARIGQFNARAARLPARQRSRELFAPGSFRLVKPFAPDSPRTGQAAHLASVANHGRKPLSPRTAFTGSLPSAPTNPGDSLASPCFGWSHNSSFKPTPHRGVNSVLYATLHAVAAPLRVGLTQALGLATAHRRLMAEYRIHSRFHCCGQLIALNKESRCEQALHASGRHY